MGFAFIPRCRSLKHCFGGRKRVPPDAPFWKVSFCVRVRRRKGNFGFRIFRWRLTGLFKLMIHLHIYWEKLKWSIATSRFSDVTHYNTFKFWNIQPCCRRLDNPFSATLTCSTNLQPSNPKHLTSLRQNLMKRPSAPKPSAPPSTSSL